MAMGVAGLACLGAGRAQADDLDGQFLTMNDILFVSKVKPTRAATALAKTIENYSHK
ncbi:MAG: hypothetical protein ABSE16_18235 [Verrucomicrobiota bacterium]|jgi:hypothetical protein